MVKIAVSKSWLFGWIEYQCFDEIVVVKVFNKPIYQRVSKVKKLLGFTWGSNKTM